MKIAIETSALEGNNKFRGVGSYTKLLTEALVRFEPSHTYIHFQGMSRIPSVDVVHYPFFDPFYLTLPLIKQKPVVVTVHDVIPIAYPKNFPRGIRGSLKWHVQKMSLRGASQLITDSNASKHDIHTFIGIQRNKIHIVYLAPSEIFKPIRETSVLDAVQKKYNLPDRYLLYVGDVNWNKNIEGLLESFARIQKSHKDLRLVLVGRSFLDNNLSEVLSLNARIKRLKLDDFVLKVGRIEQSDLPAIYSRAHVYIQPSYAEGFGLPVLEAMACDSKVVTSKESSLSEVAGPALQFDPGDIQSIVDSIELTMQIPKSVWVPKAREWVSHYSWKQVAQETVEVYKKAVSISQ